MAVILLVALGPADRAVDKAADNTAVKTVDELDTG